MFEEINKEHCDVFTIDEFEYLRKYQIITKHDGDGYWATSTKFSYFRDCFKIKPDWATCVVWFNK